MLVVHASTLNKTYLFIIYLWLLITILVYHQTFLLQIKIVSNKNTKIETEKCSQVY